MEAAIEKFVGHDIPVATHLDGSDTVFGVAKAKLVKKRP
jgi:hypothetical protein